MIFDHILNASALPLNIGITMMLFILTFAIPIVVKIKSKTPQTWLVGFFTWGFLLSGTSTVITFLANLMHTTIGEELSADWFILKLVLQVIGILLVGLLLWMFIGWLSESKKSN